MKFSSIKKKNRRGFRNLLGTEKSNKNKRQRESSAKVVAYCPLAHRIGTTVSVRQECRWRLGVAFVDLDVPSCPQSFLFCNTLTISLTNQPYNYFIIGFF